MLAFQAASSTIDRATRRRDIASRSGTKRGLFGAAKVGKARVVPPRPPGCASYDAPDAALERFRAASTCSKSAVLGSRPVLARPRVRNLPSFLSISLSLLESATSGSCGLCEPQNQLPRRQLSEFCSRVSSKKLFFLPSGLGDRLWLSVPPSLLPPPLSLSLSMSGCDGRFVPRNRTFLHLFAHGNILTRI